MSFLLTIFKSAENNLSTTSILSAANVTPYLAGCIGLSGTPMQNCTDELWCTMNTVSPGTLKRVVWYFEEGGVVL